jgi:hypothetical protein
MHDLITITQSNLGDVTRAEVDQTMAYAKAERAAATLAAY